MFAELIALAILFELSNSFKISFREHYRAEMQNVDFSNDATRQGINQWVSDETNKKIENLLAKALGPMTRMILVNAIYFKGDWAKKFDAKDTKKEKFYRSDGSSVDVDMMNMKKSSAWIISVTSKPRYSSCHIKGNPWAWSFCCPTIRMALQSLSQRSLLITWWSCGWTPTAAISWLLYRGSSRRNPPVWGKHSAIGSASLARSIRIRFHFRHRTGRIRSVSDHRAGRVIDPKHQIVYLAHVTRCRRCSEMRLSGAEPVWIQTAARRSHKVHLICCDAWPIRYHYWTDDCINMITRVTMHYFKCNRMENDSILLSHTCNRANGHALK